MADHGASSYHRFLQGDQKALEELVCAYSDELVRYAFCYVRNAAAAEDIMEDTFAALIVKRKKFTENAPFKAYLFRIARNKSIDYLRSYRRTDVPLSDLENVLKSEHPECEIARRDRNERIYVCMQQLPVQYRGVLHLVYFDGFSIEETRNIMGKSRKQIYNLLTRARANLKVILEKEGIFYEDV